MDRLLIIDGMNLLFQMFYGMPSRITNRDGFPIQGVLGFVGALGKIIRRVSPTHILAIFDGETHNPRTDISADYKANRPDLSQLSDDETPFGQLPFVYASLDVMGISHCEACDCEADDVIAGYVKAYPNTEIVISSFDSDFYQLINENVSVLRYRGDKTVILTPTDIQEKLGISPSLYSQHKALTGDSSDNIKGVPKIGPKTAAELLNQFGSIDEIIRRADDIKKPSIRESVKNNVDRIHENHSLIKLDGVPVLPFSLAQCKYISYKLTTRDILSEIGIM